MISSPHSSEQQKGQPVSGWPLLFKCRFFLRTRQRSSRRCLSAPWPGSAPPCPDQRRTPGAPDHPGGPTLCTGQSRRSCTVSHRRWSPPQCRRRCRSKRCRCRDDGSAVGDNLNELTLGGYCPVLHDVGGGSESSTLAVVGTSVNHLRL